MPASQRRRRRRAWRAGCRARRRCWGRRSAWSASARRPRWPARQPSSAGESWSAGAAAAAPRRGRRRRRCCGGRTWCWTRCWAWRCSRRARGPAEAREGQRRVGSIGPGSDRCLVSLRWPFSSEGLLRVQQARPPVGCGEALHLPPSGPDRACNSRVPHSAPSAAHASTVTEETPFMKSVGTIPKACKEERGAASGRPWAGASAACCPATCSGRARWRWSRCRRPAPSTRRWSTAGSSTASSAGAGRARALRLIQNSVHTSGALPACRDRARRSPRTRAHVSGSVDG